MKKIVICSFATQRPSLGTFRDLFFSCFVLGVHDYVCGFIKRDLTAYISHGRVTSEDLAPPPQAFPFLLIPESTSCLLCVLRAFARAVRSAWSTALPLLWLSNSVPLSGLALLGCCNSVVCPQPLLMLSLTARLACAWVLVWSLPETVSSMGVGLCLIQCPQLHTVGTQLTSVKRSCDVIM